MFMALTNSLVVLFIAVLLQIFEETFTAMLLVFHCCGGVYLGNSQVSVYRTIGLFIAWMVIGLIGAFLFVIIQMILLIDFAHGWSESWVEKYEETEAKCYYYGKLRRKEGS